MTARELAAEGGHSQCEVLLQRHMQLSLSEPSEVATETRNANQQLGSDGADANTSGAPSPPETASAAPTGGVGTTSLNPNSSCSQGTSATAGTRRQRKKLGLREYSKEEVEFMIADSRTGNRSQPVGEGRYARVYKGLMDGRDPVAVKILTEETETAVKQFDVELEGLKELRDPAIVSLRGVCMELRALVLEWAEGGDVEKALRNGCVDIKGKSVKFTWEYRIRMAVEVLRPLAELHSVQEFCHRDVKPSNILLDGNLHAKLADFAGVRNLPEEPGTCTGTGTGNQSVYSTETYADPVYMREGGRNLDSSFDIYAWGMTLLHMMAGQGGDRFRKARELLQDEAAYRHSDDPEYRDDDISAASVLDDGAGAWPNWASMGETSLLSTVRECIAADRSKRPSASMLLQRMHAWWLEAEKGIAALSETVYFHNPEESERVRANIQAQQEVYRLHKLILNSGKIPKQRLSFLAKMVTHCQSVGLIEEEEAKLLRAINDKWNWAKHDLHIPTYGCAP